MTTQYILNLIDNICKSISGNRLLLLHNLLPIELSEELKVYL